MPGQVLAFRRMNSALRVTLNLRVRNRLEQILPPSKNLRIRKAGKWKAVSSRTLSELPTKTSLEFKRRNLAQSPPRTQRNSPRYEQPILPIIHADHLHLRGEPFVGRADRRIQQADSRTRQPERVYLCAKTRATFVRRHRSGRKRIMQRWIDTSFDSKKR